MQIKNFLIALVVIPILDFIFLGLFFSDFYKTRMEGLITVVDGSMQINYWAAAAVYLLLAFAIAFFSECMIESFDYWWMAAMNTGILGFVIYGVYDFTNHATLKSWPLSLMAVDIAWGTFVCAVTGTLVYFFGSKT